MAKPFLIWMTGLSGAGKTTLAQSLLRRLDNPRVFHLDGDEFRAKFCADLSFSDEDRKTNIERAKGFCELLLEKDFSIVASFISPKSSVREKVFDCLRPLAHVNEVYVKASLETCAERDPKGLYKKRPENFTGFDSKYEEPANPDLVLNTENTNVDECVDQLIQLVTKR